MPRVMISYRNIPGQTEFAESLEKELANAGIETWLDRKNIPPFSRWEEEIFKGIINSDYVVLCLSPEYFASETCLFECYIARGYGKILLPIIVPYEGRQSVFDMLGDFEATRGIDHLHIISFHTREILGLLEEYDALIQRLVRAITNPIPPDAHYDVYFSFRWKQATFATQVADDLNQAGIKTFIHTRATDVGNDWRRVSWNATLKAKIHIVVLSPDVAGSEYIGNEVLVMRTKKNAEFIPILATEFVNDKNAIDLIRDSFAQSKNLSMLTEIQWNGPKQGYSVFINDLIGYIKGKLSG